MVGWVEVSGLMSDVKAIAEMTIDEVLTLWPETAGVFNAHNMACVGCVVAPFYTVADAATVYQLPTEEFVRELVKVLPPDQAMQQ